MTEDKADEVTITLPEDVEGLGKAGDEIPVSRVLAWGWEEGEKAGREAVEQSRDEPKPTDHWLERPLFDPEFGNMLGRDYFELLYRTASTWGFLIGQSLRASIVAILAVFVMASVPRGAWWLLIGGLSPFLGLGASIAVGQIKMKRRIFDDGRESLELDQGRLCLRFDEGTRNEFYMKMSVAGAMFSMVLLYTFPALAYSSVLVLSGAWLDVPYGGCVIDTAASTLVAFLAVWIALAVVASFCFRVFIECLRFLPALIAHWMTGGK
jgi:hypothetical protein